MRSKKKVAIGIPVSQLADIPLEGPDMKTVSPPDQPRLHWWALSITIVFFVASMTYIIGSRADTRELVLNAFAAVANHGKPSATMSGVSYSSNLK